MEGSFVIATSDNDFGSVSVYQPQPALGTNYDKPREHLETARGTDNLTWDAENRPVSIVTSNGTSTFVYDGDGKRVKKIEGGQTTLYINRFFEKSGSDNISYYYLGGKMVAMRRDSTLTYIYQDHPVSGTGQALGSTTVTDNGTVSSMKFYPFGGARSGSVATDKLFTGQRRDIATAGSELYYYGARYYDPVIGRFISPDTIVPSPMNPQALNRYSYASNNPLRYIDPTGHDGEDVDAPGEGTNSPEYRAYFNFYTKYGYVLFADWKAGGGSLLGVAYYMAIRAMPPLKGSFNPNNLRWGPAGMGSITLGGELPDSSLAGMNIDASATLLAIAISLTGVHILIDANLMNVRYSLQGDFDIRQLAATIAHELSHAKEGRFSDSIEEEARAYQDEAQVRQWLGISLGFSGYFSSSRTPSNARLYLGTAGGTAANLYAVLPDSPPTGDAEWATIIAMVNAMRTSLSSP